MPSAITAGLCFKNRRTHTWLIILLSLIIYYIYLVHNDIGKHIEINKQLSEAYFS